MSALLATSCLASAAFAVAVASSLPDDRRESSDSDHLVSDKEFQIEAPIPWSEMEARAMADYRGDGLSVRPTERGAFVDSVFQRLRGEATPEGLWIASTSETVESDRFRVVAARLGRSGGERRALSARGQAKAEGEVARFLRPGLVEEYRTGIDGLRQDFLLLDRPSGAGELRLDLDVSGARVEPAGYGARLVLDGSGRRIAYSRLYVTDAKGRELPARMEVVGSDSISIWVEDTEAAYPVRVDPTFSDENWISMGGIAGANDDVNALVADDEGNLYVGGRFTIIGDIWANRIAMWDGESWSPLGSGLGGPSTQNQQVFALAIAKGHLYVGGFFTTAGGAPASRIARWELGGTGDDAWSTLGSGVAIPGSVSALVATENALFVGGGFDTAGGVPANRVARWELDGEGDDAWSSLGSGLNDVVAALTVAGNDLYVGGSFTTAGGQSANRIAKWEIGGSSDDSWSTLGSGLWGGLNIRVLALAVDGERLYASGRFTSAGDAPANNIARWTIGSPDDSGWSALGSGLTNLGDFPFISFPIDVNALAIEDGRLYAAGSFTAIGSFAANNRMEANRIAVWTIGGTDDESWSTLGMGLSSQGSALAIVDGKLYVGGSFASAGEVPAEHIASWEIEASTSNGNDEERWSALGPGIDKSQTINALAVVESDLYVGGGFSRIGGVPANGIARWDGTSWSALGSGVGGSGNNRFVHDLVVAGNDLYVAGSFLTVGGKPANRVARWTIGGEDDESWSALGSGVRGALSFSGSALALAVTDDHLYVGGNFTTAGGAPAANIARWERGSLVDEGWTTLGSGVNNTVRALLIDGDDLYVGGTFSQAGGSTTGFIAKWEISGQGDDTGWSSLGSGVGSGVSALAIAFGDLYVGGGFFSAGGQQSVRNIAKWEIGGVDDSSWSPLGSGMSRGSLSSSVNSLAVVNNDLYVGGVFHTAGGQTGTNNIAKWKIGGADDTAWSPLGSGADNEVQALAAIGDSLFVGGSFVTAGGKISPSLAKVDLSSFAPPPAQTIHELEFGVPFLGNLPNAGARSLFVVDAPPGGHLRISLVSLDGIGLNEVFVRRGEPPTAGAFDQRFAERGHSHELLVGNAGAGLWYILVRGADVPPGGSAFSLEAEFLTGLVLESAEPTQAGNAGAALFALNGAGFDKDVRLELLSGGTSVRSGVISTLSPSRLTGVLDLLGLAPGFYDLQIVQGEQTVSWPIEVFEGGEARFEAKLISPSRLGRVAPANIIVEYKNTGNISMPAPLLVLRGDNRPLLSLDASQGARGLWTLARPAGFGDTIQILASGAVPGILQPGETRRVSLFYAGIEPPFSPSRNQIQFELKSFDGSSDEPIDWDAFKEPLRPQRVDADAWDVIWNNFTSATGSTWGDYAQMLVDNSVYLGRLGIDVTDVVELLGFALDQADGLDAISSLATATDASVMQPGLDLVFERAYPSSISRRHRVGPLGRGWYHNWEFKIEVEEDDAVTVTYPGGLRRRFEPDVRGGFFSQAGDRGMLTRLDQGRHQLRERSGFALVFGADGFLESAQDAKGNRITATYANGQLVRLAHDAGGQLEFAYAGQRLQSVTDSRGTTATFAYDASQRLVGAASTGWDPVSYAYLEAEGAATEHALALVSYPDGTSARFSYDEQGRLSAYQEGDSAGRVEFEYPGGGAVLVRDEGGSESTSFFDHRGLPTRLENADRDSLQLAYDSRFNLVSVAAADGSSTSIFRNVRGDPIRSRDELGHDIRYRRDEGGRLTALIDARGHETALKRDEHGNLTSVVHPDGSRESYGYDQTGEVVEVVNRRGQTSLIERDANGRIVRRETPDGRVFEFSYDSRGNLALVEDSLLGETSLTHDERDLLAEIVYPDGKGFAYTYDPGGRRTSRVSHDGYTLRYAYDDAGRLIRLEDEEGKALIAYHYDSAGRLVREDKANGTSTEYEYDHLDQVASVVNHDPEGSVTSRFDYAYDVNGNRISMTTLDGETRYEYDRIGQLVSATYPDSRTVAYEYDPSGNRIRSTESGNVAEYQANELNQYTQVGDAAFAFDDDGNLTSKTDSEGETTYEYDEANRLIRVVAPSGAVTEYRYDFFGNRVAAIVDGEETRLVHDPSGLPSVAAEYAEDGSLKARYDYGLGLVARRGSDSQPHYYHFDAQGNAAELTDAAGATANRYAYDAFGRAEAVQEAVPNPFRYVGRMGVMTGDDGLIHMRAREYDPDTGAFLSPDPILFADSLANAYRYAHNNPVNFVDPEGEAIPIAFYLLGVGAKQATLRIGAHLAARQLATHSMPASTSAQLVARSAWGGAKALATRASHLGKSAMAAANKSALNGIAWAQSHWIHFQQTARISAADITIVNLFGGLFFGIAEERGDLTLNEELTILIPTSQLFEAGQMIGEIGVKISRLDPDDVKYGALELFLAIEDRLTEFLDSDLPSLIGSLDPNEIIPPAGFGPQNYLQAVGPYAYRINFENAEEAEAPAQVVEIRNPIPDHLEMDTLEFSSVGFGDHFFPVPPDSQTFEHTEAISIDGFDFEVTIEIWLDHSAREIHARFSSLDPETGLPPPVEIGFLPPEDGTGRGMGHVAYLIDPQPDLPTDTEIRNIGFITFDPLAGLPTFRTDLSDEKDPNSPPDPDRQALVTIDADGPTSRVEALAEESGSTFLVSWSGEDSGAGIAGFDIYVSVDDGPWELWLSNASQTSEFFVGSVGRSYGFFSAARDGVGFSEPPPAAETLPQATTFAAFASEIPRLSDVKLVEIDGVSILRFRLIQAVEGETWTIQRSEFLTGPWKDVETLVVGPDGSVEFEEQLPEHDSSFYRANKQN